jgi:crotonobetainyl-CoA:carnitine CoA-transferase CaiB-like acyl-CoA transferase
MAPFQAFHTADRPIVVAVSSQAHWRGFCSALGHSEWLQDSRFADGNARRLHLEALEAVIAPVLRRATADVWLARLSEAQVPSGPLRTVGEVASDPDLNDRGMFCEVDFDGVPVRVVGSPLRIDGLRRTARRVPALDADGEEGRAGCAASGERGGEVR